MSLSGVWPWHSFNIPVLLFPSYVKWDDMLKTVQILKRHVLNKGMNTGLDVGPRVQTPSYKMKGSEVLICSTVTLVSNTELLLRVARKRSHAQKGNYASDAGVNEPYYGDHFVIYTCIKSSCCIP